MRAQDALSERKAVVGQLRATTRIAFAIAFAASITTGGLLFTVLLGEHARAQQRPQDPIVPNSVHRSLASHPDGRASVLILLDHTGVLEIGDPVVRMREIARRQDAVLNLFNPREFELILRPDHVGALTGRVTADGLRKLAAHPLVSGVGLDAMDYIYQIRVPTEADIQALGATSSFVVDEVVPEMIPNLVSPARALLFAPPPTSPSGSSAYCEELVPNSLSQDNWKVNIEPGTPATEQNETSISASPVQDDVLLAAWNDTTTAGDFTVGFGASINAGDTWPSIRSDLFNQLQDANPPVRLELDVDPGTAIGGNGWLYLSVLTTNETTNCNASVLFARSGDQGLNWKPIQQVPGSFTQTAGVGNRTDRPFICADPSPLNTPSTCPRSERLFVT